VPGTAGYDLDPAVLVERFERVRFEDVHRDVLPWLPDAPAAVLDVGAGSGRDAAALAARGHRVVAVEPVAGLRALARARHAAHAIEWIDDRLPELAVVRRSGRRFEWILLSAVWMHLDATERACAFDALVELLAPGGLVVLSLRHGPVPAGRRMFAVSADETIALAAARGLRTRHHGERPSLLSGDSVTWSVLAFSR
jgi:SAM-dependent methyltransferase